MLPVAINVGSGIIAHVISMRNSCSGQISESHVQIPLANLHSAGQSRTVPMRMPRVQGEPSEAFGSRLSGLRP